MDKSRAKNILENIRKESVEKENAILFLLNVFIEKQYRSGDDK